MRFIVANNFQRFVKRVRKCAYKRLVEAQPKNSQSHQRLDGHFVEKHFNCFTQVVARKSSRQRRSRRRRRKKKSNDAFPPTKWISRVSFIFVYDHLLTNCCLDPSLMAVFQQYIYNMSITCTYNANTYTHLCKCPIINITKIHYFSTKRKKKEKKNCLIRKSNAENSQRNSIPSIWAKKFAQQKNAVGVYFHLYVPTSTHLPARRTGPTAIHQTSLDEHSYVDNIITWLSLT